MENPDDVGDPQAAADTNNGCRCLARVTEATEQAQSDHAPVCTENLNPDIVVMESAEDGERFDASSRLNRARNRRIFVQ